MHKENTWNFEFRKTYCLLSPDLDSIELVKAGYLLREYAEVCYDIMVFVDFILFITAI